MSGKFKSSSQDLKHEKTNEGASSTRAGLDPSTKPGSKPEESLVPVETTKEETGAVDTVKADATIHAVTSSTVAGEEAKPESGEEKIRKLTQENARLFDQLLRKQAEFENFRKRTEKEKAEFMRFATFELVRDLLPVVDGFERALKVESDEAFDGFTKGMGLIYKQLLDGFERAGLKPIEAVGQKFDPNFHQAVSHEEHDDLEDNVVIEEFQRGYLFQGRLLRAAMVKVAVGKKSPSTEPVSESSR